MNDIKPYELHQSISNLLKEKELKKALDALSKCIKEVPEWDLHTSYEDIETSYRYMLQYFRQNVNDPQRNALYNDLIRKSYILNDQVLVSLNLITSNELYYVCLREERKTPKKLSDFLKKLESFTEEIAIAELINDNATQDKKILELCKSHETTYANLFKYVYVTPTWDLNMASMAKEFLDSVLLQPSDLALFISAVTIGAMEVFDTQKFLFLLDAYKHTDTEINQRALVGIVLLSLKHNDRLEYEPEIKDRLSLLNKSSYFRCNIVDVQLNLFRTRETQKVEKKMREEIIPEVIKNTGHIKTFNLEEIEEELFNDKNPEWSKKAEDLNNKLIEMGDMQNEGIDVYMSSFSLLKSYPFFAEISNWFYPFDLNHTITLKCFKEKNQEQKSLLLNFANSPFLCNSDKYSFCLTLEFFEKHNKNQDISKQFKAAPEVNSNTANHPTYINRRYIHDLYRFDKLCSQRQKRNEIFNKPLNIYNCAFLKKSINDIEQLNKITTYLFDKEYYEEVTPILEVLVETSNNTAEEYQKLGFCYQREKNYQKALDAYIHADIRQSDNTWTMQHIAQCYSKLKNYKKAISNYERVTTLDPNNLKILLYIGQCYMELKKYEEAFALFFKVEYLNPESAQPLRAIAWYSFITHKWEQANKYYNKLLQHPKHSCNDFLNAGHTAWCQHDIESASKLYIQGCNFLGNTENFITLLSNDESVLLANGVKKEEIPLMLDIIRYKNI